METEKRGAEQPDFMSRIDGLTHRLTTEPDFETGPVPEYDLNVAYLAAAQRRAIMEPSFNKIARTIAADIDLDEVLERVQSGRPSASELQILLLSLEPLHGIPSLNKVGGLAKTRVAILGDLSPSARKNHRIDTALTGYVNRKYNVRFQPTAKAVEAIVAAEVIAHGLWTLLDLQGEHAPIADAFIEHALSLYRQSVGEVKSERNFDRGGVAGAQNAWPPRILDVFGKITDFASARRAAAEGKWVAGEYLETWKLPPGRKPVFEAFQLQERKAWVEHNDQFLEKVLGYSAEQNLRFLHIALQGGSDAEVGNFWIALTQADLTRAQKTELEKLKPSVAEIVERNITGRQAEAIKHPGAAPLWVMVAAADALRKTKWSLVTDSVESVEVDTATIASVFRELAEVLEVPSAGYRDGTTELALTAEFLIAHACRERKPGFKLHTAIGERHITLARKLKDFDVIALPHYIKTYFENAARVR